MITPPGEELKNKSQLGWRTYDDAIKDDEYLKKREWTGITWGWINKNGQRVQGSQLS